MSHKAAQQPSMVVFTDLDGSLMEHESYAIDAARPALAELNRRHIPVVMNSSKTAAEMQALKQELNLDAAFVCENGAALHLAATDTPPVIEFGRARQQWLPLVHELRQRLGLDFTGFADWTAAEISALTGLNAQAAELARQRQYSEPILWRGSRQQKARFTEQLAELELILLEGGRFHSIQSRHGKHLAMDWFRQQPGGATSLHVALGDSPNDQDMLEAADIAVVIKSAKCERIMLDKPAWVIRSQRPGPAGWHDAIMEILDTLDRGDLSRPVQA